MPSRGHVRRCLLDRGTLRVFLQEKDIDHQLVAAVQDMVNVEVNETECFERAFPVKGEEKLIY